MVWDFEVSKELKLVEESIRENTLSDEPLLTDIASYVVGAGGKRIRPTVTLLAYKTLGGRDTKKIVEISAAYELIHNATLIHDDINDGSTMRRGQIPAHKKYGIHNALVTGDFLFVKGFAMGGRFDSNIVEITADACQKLAEGEIKQKLNKWNTEISTKDYFEIIRRKTAMPIQAGAMVGAYLAKGSLKEIAAMGNYGLNLGMAFQVTDDILDVVGNGTVLGKRPGSDLREGNITIMAINGLLNSDNDDRKKLKKLLKKRKKTKKDMQDVLKFMKRPNTVKVSKEVARGFSEKAKSELKFVKDGKYKTEMLRLADYVTERDF